MFGMKFLGRTEYKRLREDMTRIKRDLEDIGWINLSSDPSSQDNVIAGGFKKMLQRVKLIYYNNPLAGHWVHLTTSFVFGEGVSTPKATDPKIQEVVDEFWNDPDNQKALTSYSAQTLLSNKLQYEGNLFFLLFDDEEGRVRVRILNTAEIVDIISDVDDRLRANFYKVQHTEKKYNFSGDNYEFQNQKYVYYPDIEAFDINSFKIPASKLRDEARILHVKINCDINDKFGIPELYRGLDWIQAHKGMAEDLATLVKALSQFAWKKKVKGSAKQVTNLANALTSKLNLTNLKSSAGQMQVENQGIDLESVDVKTGGVKVGTEGLRQMKLMVAAASGIFEHYYGDPSTGNLATAKSMELPMVKKFTNRQKLWTDIYLTILDYVVDCKISVGKLEGTEEIDIKNRRKTFKTNLDRLIDIDFPPLLEVDLKPLADALSIAKDKGLIGEKLAAQLFMLGANVNNIEEEIEELLKDIENKKKEQPETFKPLQTPEDLKKMNKSIPIEEVALAEAIDTPQKTDMIERTNKKSNYVQQRMNAYGKVLKRHFKDMRKAVSENAVFSGAVGHIPDLHNIVSTFGDSIREASRKAFDEAVNIGEKYAQRILKDFNISLYEAKGRAPRTLQEKLQWNDTYITDSLSPAIENRIMKEVRQVHESTEAFKASVINAVGVFEGRVELYIGAFWHVEESAVKESLDNSGLHANFAGSMDADTCQGCSDAVLGNPYPIDSVPIPGSFECSGRCRHVIQVIKK